MKNLLPRLLLWSALFAAFIFSFSSGLAAKGSPSQHKVYLPIVRYNRLPSWIGPDGGLIASVAISPRNPAIVYAGSWGGGVYKSSDGGKTWIWKSRGIGNLTVVSMAVDPLDPNVAYVGTYGGRLYKTANGGESWSLSSQGIQEGAIVYSIVIDPENPKTVYISTRGIASNNAPPWRGVIYRSTDGGENWETKLDDLGGRNVQDWVYALAIHPRDPNIIFAASHEQGMIRSNNYGESWRQVNNGIENQSTRTVVFGPTADTEKQVYTAVWEKKGVYKSVDLGETWQAMDRGILGAQIYVMDIDPFQPQILYLATYNMGVMKTSNGGKRWNEAGLQSDPIATVRINPADSRIIFAGTVANGLFTSQDGGGSWAHSQSGLKASSATSLIASPDQPGTYYAGTGGTGVLLSTDRGVTWAGFNQNIGSRWINALIEQPNRKVLFALTDSAGLYRCDLKNTAGCWQRSDSGLSFAFTTDQAGQNTVDDLTHPFSSRTLFLEALGGNKEFSHSAWPIGSGLLAMAFAPSNPDVAYLGTAGSGVYISSNGGASWLPAGLSGRTVWSLAVNPNNPALLYAAIDQPGTVKMSPDGGKTWRDASLPGVSGYSLAFSPNSPSVLYAGTSNGVYHLSGDGPWQQSGLSGTTIVSLAFHPAHPNLLFAGSTNGAFFSSDYGFTWKPGPVELSGHTIQAINFSAHEPEMVFYSTTAHGVLRAEIEHR